jgi:hypothetical protein
MTDQECRELLTTFMEDVLHEAKIRHISIAVFPRYKRGGGMNGYQISLKNKNGLYNLPQDLRDDFNYRIAQLNLEVDEVYTTVEGSFFLRPAQRAKERSHKRTTTPKNRSISPFAHMNQKFDDEDTSNKPSPKNRFPFWKKNEDKED